MEDFIKSLDSLAEELRKEYIEKIRFAAKEANESNEEAIKKIDEILESHIERFQEELDILLKEELTRLDQRKALLEEKMESSKSSLKERFTKIFLYAYDIIKSFFS